MRRFSSFANNLGILSCFGCDYRHCSSTTTLKTPPRGSEDATFSQASTGAAAAKAAKAHEARWSSKPQSPPQSTASATSSSSSSGLKQTTLEESQQLESEQAERVAHEMWCSVPTLYRRLVKLIISKFGDHPDIAVRAWRQAKFEFYHFRDAPQDEVPTLVHRGKMIHDAVQGGVIPVVQDPKTKLAYCKYDKKTLDAAGGIVDPISAEEFLRRNHDKLSKEELLGMRDKLKDAGRWGGADEFKSSDIPKLKTKRKIKCTDPDEDDASNAAETSPPDGKGSK